MKNFSIEALTSEAYTSFPEAKRKPLIGLTGNHSDIDVTIRDFYHKQIVAAGGVPVIIPPVTDTSVIVNTLESLDGLILTGGGDYNPLWCGEEPSPNLHNINSVRDSAELLITQLAFNRQIPMLGICRGIQTLAMALGGHVEQHHSPVDGGIAAVKHSQDADRSEPTHTVTLKQEEVFPLLAADFSYKESILFSVFGKKTLPVNSFHHQVVDDPGTHFRATAWAKDGAIEAIESTEQKSVLGVQWHPECLGEDGLPLFQWLVERAEEFRKAKELHSRILTLDTHCDTPMFFHQGVNFLNRDPRIKVDLHKMTEGHQDAVTMVCYLPEPWTPTNGAHPSRKGKTFAELVHLDSFALSGSVLSSSAAELSPKAYTDFIFDEIGKIVSSQPDYLAFARTPEELYSNKAVGKKSIILGIENGTAIEDDLSNIEHFWKRGITYITLCHNGDNRICDSAKGANTWGGVSEFGEKVIKEMNRLGIMVDLSHGGEKSFYDALDISSTPIVCSHANCKALCDHPRNLTDDQLRALARVGGVAHTTFYPSFLEVNGEADIRHAVQHLEHAIDIMGIDCVGIGTDFDGDGGVPGMNDSSELINFTIQLLRRRYSEEDIRKIWGGNWLRVMKQVQQSKI